MHAPSWPQLGKNEENPVIENISFISAVYHNTIFHYFWVNLNPFSFSHSFSASLDAIIFHILFKYKITWTPFSLENERPDGNWKYIEQHYSIRWLSAWKIVEYIE